MGTGTATGAARPGRIGPDETARADIAVAGGATAGYRDGLSGRGRPDQGVQGETATMSACREEIATLAASIHAAEARLTERIADLVEGEGWVGSGVRNVAHWLTLTCGFTSGEARQRAEVAARRGELPELFGAFDAGSLSLGVVRCAERVATADNDAEVTRIATVATGPQAARTFASFRRAAAAERQRLADIDERRNSRNGSDSNRDGVDRDGVDRDGVDRDGVDRDGVDGDGVDGSGDSPLSPGADDEDASNPGDRATWMRTWWDEYQYLRVDGRLDATDGAAFRSLLEAIQHDAENSDKTNPDTDTDPDPDTDTDTDPDTDPDPDTESTDPNPTDADRTNPDRSATDRFGRAASGRAASGRAGSGRAGSGRSDSDRANPDGSGGDALVEKAGEPDGFEFVEDEPDDYAGLDLDPGPDPAPGEDAGDQPGGTKRRRRLSWVDAFSRLTRLAGDALVDANVRGRWEDRFAISVTIEAEVLLGLKDGNGVLDDGASIDATTVRDWLPAATVEGLICDRGAPLFMGRKLRVPNRKARRALKVRDGGCAFPGCDCTEFLDAHHIYIWHNGALTNIDELVLLCRLHHRLFHLGEYTIVIIDGHPHFQSDILGTGLPPPRKLAELQAGGTTAAVTPETTVRSGEHLTRYAQDTFLCMLFGGSEAKRTNIINAVG